MQAKSAFMSRLILVLLCFFSFTLALMFFMPPDGPRNAAATHVPSVTRDATSQGGESGQHVGPIRKSPIAFFAAGAPRIEVDEPIFEFGSVERGTCVEHTFVLRNAGTKPLIIEDVIPSCGCAITTLSSTVIEPQEQIEALVSLDLASREGPQEKVVLIRSNDPQQPHIRLTMVGTATSRVAPAAKQIDFDRISADNMVSEVLDIRATDDLTFDVVDIQTSLNNISADVEVVTPGKHYRLAVTLQPPLSHGPFRGWVNLLTDDTGEYKLIGILITADVVEI